MGRAPWLERDSRSIPGKRSVAPGRFSFGKRYAGKGRLEAGLPGRRRRAFRQSGNGERDDWKPVYQDGVAVLFAKVETKK